MVDEDRTECVGNGSSVGELGPTFDEVIWAYTLAARVTTEHHLWFEVRALEGAERTRVKWLGRFQNTNGLAVGPGELRRGVHHDVELFGVWGGSVGEL
jgi:hypothetical protein